MLCNSAHDNVATNKVAAIATILVVCQNIHDSPVTIAILSRVPNAYLDWKKVVKCKNPSFYTHVQYPLWAEHMTEQISWGSKSLFFSPLLWMSSWGETLPTERSPLMASNFAFRIKPFRPVHAVTCKRPMIVQPVCTACHLPFWACSQLLMDGRMDGRTDGQMKSYNNIYILVTCRTCSDVGRAWAAML